ncbi:MAG: hypothetical protein ACJ75R_03985 [Solirubrobacterales bacterium]
MRRGFKSGVLALFTLALFAGAAGAQSQPVAPWDGQNPFRCRLQNVGTGTDFPDPNADPFCVEFDKTNQNVTGFGLAEFLLQEPARTAAASTKCFYFQRDHWTGSIVQGQSPELWHWDGNYFFDRARGVGGVSVRNFRLGGVKMDATPFVPAAYRPYFDSSGGGGVVVTLETDPDPACRALVDTPAERAAVYADYPAIEPCVEPGGAVHRGRIGRVRLGMRRDRVLHRLGPPGSSAHRIDGWCLIGKGALRVAYRHGRVSAVLTTGRGQTLHGIGRGDPPRRALRRLHADATAYGHRMRMLVVHTGGRRVALMGVAHGRIRWVAITRLPLANALLRLIAAG